MGYIQTNSVSDPDPYHLAGSVSDDTDPDLGRAKNLNQNHKKKIP